MRLALDGRCGLLLPAKLFDSGAHLRGVRPVRKYGTDPDRLRDEIETKLVQNRESGKGIGQLAATSPVKPSASFLLMMLDAMSGMDSTVAVASRSAYILRSAGAISGDWPKSAHPSLSTCARASESERFVRNPGIDSNLSRVPPVFILLDQRLSKMRSAMTTTRNSLALFPTNAEWAVEILGYYRLVKKDSYLGQCFPIGLPPLLYDCFLSSFSTLE